MSASKQEITLGYVLQFDTIENLTRDWIEGKVASLSYEGFGDLEEWCQSRGIPILVPEGQRSRVVELIATRNLIVHNRTIVDDRYIKTTASTQFSAGDLRKLQVSDFTDARDLLNQVVKITDGAISGKFGLRQISLRDEINSRAKNRWSEEDTKTSADDPLTDSESSEASG